MARAALILFTPDELVALRADLASSVIETRPSFQSRPNVMLEAGMALMHAERQTILVRVGSVRDDPSDLAGLDYIPLSNQPYGRERLVKALEDAGCDVDRNHNEYLDPAVAGDFPDPLEQAGMPGIERVLLDTVAISGTDAIFQAGINILKDSDHRRVYVYAPTGVWEENPFKLEWFRQIAAGLQNADLPRNRRTAPSLDEFLGTYGLPERVTDAQFAKDLDDLETERLACFHGLRRARLYYLDVNTATIPGGGTILLDESVFTGLASTNRFQVDYGLMILNNAELAEITSSWYLQHVTRIARVLQRCDRPSQRTCLAEGVNNIRRQYGLKERPLGAKCRNGSCWDRRQADL
jgi:hypothetical protein